MNSYPRGLTSFRKESVGQQRWFGEISLSAATPRLALGGYLVQVLRLFTFTSSGWFWIM